MKKSARRLAELERLVEEAIVDAYGESEQRVSFYTIMDEHLQLPFETQVLGVTVTVGKLDMNAADEIVAVCQRGRERLKVPILDLPLPDPAPAGSEWIEAYRQWLRA